MSNLSALVSQWLSYDVDPSTRAEIESLAQKAHIYDDMSSSSSSSAEMEAARKDLQTRLGKRIAFGTAGLL